MNLFRRDFNPSFLGNFLELLVNDFLPLVFFLEFVLFGCRISRTLPLLLLSVPASPNPPLFFGLLCRFLQGDYLKVPFFYFVFFFVFFFLFLLIGPPAFPGAPVVKTA